jgi:hypothetical protein
VVTLHLIIDHTKSQAVAVKAEYAIPLPRKTSATSAPENDDEVRAVALKAEDDSGIQIEENLAFDPFSSTVLKKFI